MQMNDLRYPAHQTKPEDNWKKLRGIRNSLRTKIKLARHTFYQKALSSKKPKELWHTIRRILNSSLKPIADHPDELNVHFTNNTQRILGTYPSSSECLKNYITSFSDYGNDLLLRPVFFKEVEQQIKSPDLIPAKYAKPVVEYITSLLTHIINECITQNTFPTAWKESRISPVPKVDNPKECDDYRPITIIPVLPKVYERSTTSILMHFRDEIIQAMKKG